MGRIAADTTLLIDLQRERRRNAAGKAMAFLEAHLDDEFVLSAVAYGEFAAGFADEAELRRTYAFTPFEILPTTDAVALRYAEIFRALQARGALIGVNDMWIAATALHHNVPLATNNSSEFFARAGFAGARILTSGLGRACTSFNHTWRDQHSGQVLRGETESPCEWILHERLAAEQAARTCAADRAAAFRAGLRRLRRFAAVQFAVLQIQERDLFHELLIIESVFLLEDTPERLGDEKQTLYFALQRSDFAFVAARLVSWNGFVFATPERAVEHRHGR